MKLRLTLTIAFLLTATSLSLTHAATHKHHSARNADSPSKAAHKAKRTHASEANAERAHSRHREAAADRAHERRAQEKADRARERRAAAKADKARERNAQAKAERAKARHAARLAAKKQAAWREHQAKIADMSRSERRALKRHERRLAEQQAALHEQHVAAARRKKHMQALAEQQAATARKRQARRHNEEDADTPRHGSEDAPRHARRNDDDDLPARESRQAKLRRLHQEHLAQQHQERLAKLHRQHVAEQAARAKKRARMEAAAQSERHRKAVAAHNARLAAYNQRQARLEALRAQREAWRNARLIKERAAHNARLAAGRAKMVALQGDGSSGKNISFWQTVAAGVPVKVITVDLNDPNVKISAVVSRYGDGTSEPFRQMIARTNPNVAVTGTFFSLDNLMPVGDIVIDGSLVHFGGMGTALCVTPDNKADMITVKWGRHHDWSPYDFVCACGPRLLKRGRVVLDPHAERFKDKHMLAPNSRIAVGITKSNKIVFAMTHKAIYLGRLAKVMRTLGAVEAMNLDAGTSTGFYFNGTTLARPGRKLTNMIVVYSRRDRYERALTQLMPSTYRKADAAPRAQGNKTPKVARN